MLVKQRIIQSGNILEIIDFENPVPIGMNGNNPNGRNGNTTEEEKIENRKKTLKRNISSFWRLFNANKDKHKNKDKFMTLTFRRLPPSIKECDYQLNKFIKRLKYFSKTNIQYQGIRELQLEHDRNGNHYHIIFYNLPFIPHSKLLELWCDGNPYQDDKNRSGVNIKAIDDGYNEMTNYLTSYLLQEVIENDFLKGHKIIIKSKGLKKPIRSNLTTRLFEPKIDEIKKALSFIDNKITYYQMK